jgi:hypothetical protein
MGACLCSLLSSLPTVAQTMTVMPCLNSQPECINPLSEAAIAHNSEIASPDDRLESIVLGDLINLNPLSLIGSLFGGGGFRDVDLKIADLQVQVSDLVRRRAEVTVRAFMTRC